MVGFDLKQMRRERAEGLALCKKNGIQVLQNSGDAELGWSMPEGFTSESLIRFLKKKGHKRGIDRLKALAKIMNHKGLWMCDYNGADIVKWVNSDQKLRDIYTNGIFYDTLVVKECVEECEWFIQHIPVYLNGCWKDDDELNEECKKQNPELYQKVMTHFQKQVTRQGGSAMDVDIKMAWFWMKEF